MGRKCVCCGVVHGGGGYSHAQWLRGRGKSQCKACVRERITSQTPKMPLSTLKATQNAKKKEKGTTAPPKQVRKKDNAKKLPPKPKAAYGANKCSKGVGASKSTACATPKQMMSSAFAGFFEEGGLGCQLFQMDGGIRSYLSLTDLSKCSASGIPMLKEMCRTYFVPDLVENKGKFRPSQELRIALGTDVMQRVTKYSVNTRKIYHHPKYPRGTQREVEACFGIQMEKKRPKAMYKRSLGNIYKAYIYHPDELDQVHAIIDRYLRLHGVDRTADRSAPRLVSAHYCSAVGRKRITKKVASMIKDDEFVLTSPRKYAKYWYNDLFGDPFPRQTKYLEIVLECEATGQKTTHRFREDTRVDLAIRSTSM